jgi:RND family efflux transporter MFP subunit
MEAAVIRPYRQATISSEVSGVIEELYLQEGDPVVGGQVIFEISKEFFELTVERAQERLWALEIALEQARADLGIQEYLFSHNAGTRSQLVKARSEAEIAEHRVNEAKIDLAFALRDLQSCRVKAPFAGHIISLYNKQHESVQRFDQLFLMADTSKVYAVVNAPEQILTQLRKGLPAIFVRPDGERYMGVVARISKPIDPSSKTKRVHVLINNAASKLEMGMLGAVRLMGEKE